MPKKYLYQTEDKELIMVIGKAKPSTATCSDRGVWSVREWNGVEWIMPCFPEITWGTLQKFNFIGELE